MLSRDAQVALQGELKAPAETVAIDGRNQWLEDAQGAKINEAYINAFRCGPVYGFDERRTELRGRWQRIFEVGAHTERFGACTSEYDHAYVIVVSRVGEFFA